MDIKETIVLKILTLKLDKKLKLKMITKRFNNLKADGRLRTDLEVWTKDSQIDIIR